MSAAARSAAASRPAHPPAVSCACQCSPGHTWRDLLRAVAASCGGPGTNVPARPVRIVQPGYDPPMTTGREHARLPSQPATRPGTASRRQPRAFVSATASPAPRPQCRLRKVKPQRPAPAPDRLRAALSWMRYPALSAQIARVWAGSRLLRNAACPAGASWLPRRPGRPPLPGFGSPGPAGWPAGHDEVSGAQACVTSPGEVPVS